MKRVYKYPLRVDDRQVVMLPKGAEVLSVQSQNEAVFLWALVDPCMEEHTAVTIRIHGTGHDIEDDFKLKFIGTVQMYDGQLVFHVFEENKLR